MRDKDQILLEALYEQVVGNGITSLSDPSSVVDIRALNPKQTMYDFGGADYPQIQPSLPNTQYSVVVDNAQPNTNDLEGATNDKGKPIKFYWTQRDLFSPITLPIPQVAEVYVGKLFRYAPSVKEQDVLIQNIDKHLLKGGIVTIFEDSDEQDIFDESLDQPLPYTEYFDEGDAAAYDFKITPEQPEFYRVYFQSYPIDESGKFPFRDLTIDVNYHNNPEDDDESTQDVTGTGNAFRFFATVKKILMDYLAKPDNKKEIRRIEFQGQLKDGRGRSVLYKRLAKELVQTLGNPWTLEIKNSSGWSTQYLITHPDAYPFIGGQPAQNNTNASLNRPEQSTFPSQSKQQPQSLEELLLSVKAKFLKLGYKLIQEEAIMSDSIELLQLKKL